MYIFFFNDTATTEIYTLSLHDALPIFGRMGVRLVTATPCVDKAARSAGMVRAASDTTTCSALPKDRKSTRLNSSHANISYAVFCLKKKDSAGPYPLAPIAHPPPLTL